MKINQTQQYLGRTSEVTSSLSESDVIVERY